MNRQTYESLTVDERDLFPDVQIDETVPDGMVEIRTVQATAIGNAIFPVGEVIRNRKRWQRDIPLANELDSPGEWPDEGPAQPRPEFIPRQPTQNKRSHWAQGPTPDQRRKARKRERQNRKRQRRG